MESEQQQVSKSLMPKICCFNTVISKVTCGMSHTLMLSQSGHVYSMGSNGYGQLGLGESTNEKQRDGSMQTLSKLLPCLIESLVPFQVVDIASGNEHSLALTSDKLFSWGQGKYGALGISKSQNINVPTEVKFEGQIHKIAAGSRHSAFITTSQELYMFGHGTQGQLGLGEECTEKCFMPEKVQKIPKVK